MALNATDEVAFAWAGLNATAAAAANATAAAAAAEVLAKVADLQQNLTIAWILLCSFFIISMQLGFAMLEVGSVRSAHRMTVLVMNIMDSAVSCVGFWAYTRWASDALILDDGGRRQPHLMLMQWAFCATSVTICSGSIAERAHMLAYLCFALVMAGLVYPVVATSVWTPAGLLHREFHGRFDTGYDYHDFSGGGVVHLCGGCAALMGNALLGRRIVRPLGAGALHGGQPSQLSRSPAAACRRPGSAPRSRTHSEELAELQEQDERQAMLTRPAGGWQRRFDAKAEDEKEFRACTYLQVMGMFTLWIGFYGFNAGATRCMSQACRAAAGVVVWNTTLSACAAALGAYLFSFGAHKHLSMGFLCNGVLAGLVSITASCDVATETAAVLIGLVAGLCVYPAASHLCQHLLVDDPVDAIALHAFCGLFGVVAAGFCQPDCANLAAVGGGGMPEQRRFCSPDHSPWKQLVAQLWGAFAEIWWTAGISLGLWSAFAVAELARALEVEYLEEANDLLCQMVTPALESQADTDVLWARVASRCAVARRILRKHGWDGVRFEEGAPRDVWQLRWELQQARGEKLETALEVESCVVLRCLALCVHSCRPLRELPLLRLRISPVSEICGFGAADLDGGQLYILLQKAVARMTETQQEHSPLKTEVRELALAVQSQESVLRALMRGGRGGAVAAPARRSCGGSGRQSFWQRRAPDPAVPSVPELEAQLEAPPSPLSHSPARLAQSAAISVHSASTDRTVSDRSAGNITPLSAVDSTPPPSMLGRRGGQPPTAQGGAAAVVHLRDVNVQEVTSHLMSMLAAQQQLLAALQPPAGAAPATSVAEEGTLTPGLRLGRSGPVASGAVLLSALQQVVAQRQGSPTSDSGSTAEERALLGLAAGATGPPSSHL